MEVAAGKMSLKESDARPLLLALYKSNEALEKHAATYPESIEDALLQLAKDTAQPLEIVKWCATFLRACVERRKGHSKGQSLAIAVDHYESKTH